MCLAIEQMREESIAIGEARGRAIGEARGLAIGERKGEQKILFELVKDGLLTIAQAAGSAKLTEEAFIAEMKKAEI